MKEKITKNLFFVLFFMICCSIISSAQINTFPYNENFDGGAAGWTADNTTNGTWELATPANTVINSAASAPNSWITSATGLYNGSESSSVESPAFDFSAACLDPSISMSIWWESEFSWDGAVLQSSIDGGGSWQNVGANGDPGNWYNDNSINGNPGGQQEGWTGRNGSGSNGWVTASHTLNGLAGESNVVLRVAFGSDSGGNDDGFAFDDVSVTIPPSEDLQADLLSINGGGACALSNAATLTLDFTNVGCNTLTAGTMIPVSYVVNGGVSVNETYTLPADLAPLSSDSYTFTTTADLSAAGTYNVDASVSLGADSALGNNTVSESTISFAAVGIPYAEDFEGGAGGWEADNTTNGTWELATPANTVINSAASGVNSWITNATGDYNGSEDSWVRSPCFDFTTSCLDPTISMSIWYESEFSWDGAVLQSSVDGGGSWQNVGANGDAGNWYNDDSINGAPGGQQEGWTGRDGGGSNGWVTASHELTGLAGQGSVFLRVAFASDSGGNDDGFAFDDVTITPPPSDDLQADQISLDNGACMLSSTSQVILDFTNVGCNTLAAGTMIPVSYVVNGGTPVNETYTLPADLAPLSSDSYTFTTVADLSAIMAYNIDGIVSLAGDGTVGNDATSTTVESFAATAIPYFEDFEGGAGGWTADNTNNGTWELATPANTIINSAASGVNSWITNATGDYNGSEDSWVQSPCLDFSTTCLDPTINMSIWYESEFSWDGAVLQSSVDGGGSWQNVGANGDPNNWYNDGTINGAPGGQQEGWTGRNGSGSNGWVTASHELTGLAGEGNVVLRVAFASDSGGNDDGFAFDDVEIVTAPNIDLIADQVTVNGGGGCSLSNASTITVDFSNGGCNTQLAGTMVSFSYVVNGGAAIMETYSLPADLIPGDSDSYTFTATTDLSALGTYNVDASVNLAGDEDTSNDDVSTSTESFDTVTVPYSEDFEGGAGGWTANNTNNGTWELATPANTVINSAASGVNSWITNAAGDYNGSEDSWVQSPCLDFSDVCAPQIDMSIWYESEFSWDGAVLQSSVDGGGSWQNVGANGDPNNWYNDGTINGAPGGQQEGWTGRDGGGSNGWVTASHELTGLGGQGSVFLRVAFGSDSGGNDDGFAFDDISITDPGAVTVSASATSETCDGDNDGTVTANASGGLGTLEYSIDAGATYQPTPTFSGLADGDYTVIVRDQTTNCTFETMATVTAGDNATISSVNTVDELCDGGVNGSLTVTATGTGTLEYSIDGGTSYQAGATFTGLADGSYDVIARVVGTTCSDSNTGNVINAGAPVSITNVSSTPETCEGDDDGTVTITATGPGTLEYSIDSGTTWGASPTFTGLADGDYTGMVRVVGTTCTDSDGPVNIAPGSNPQITNIAVTPETGVGLDDGTITITASCDNCLGSLEYSNDGGTTWQGTAVFTGLAPSSYNVVIRDDGNTTCDDTGTASVGSADCDIALVSIASTNETCEGEDDGTITVTATCTSCPTGIEYSSDGVNFQDSNVLEDLADGDYTVIIRDKADAGCNATATAVTAIVAGDDVTISDVTTTDETCEGDDNGTLAITATGTGTLEYSIDGGTTWQATPTFSGLADDTYIAMARVVGTTCTDDNASNVIAPGSDVQIMNVAVMDEVGVDQDNGSITITATCDNCLGVLQYSIDGGTTFQATGTFTGLAPDDYDIVVQDNGNTSCEDTDMVTVNAAPCNFTGLTASVTDESCNDEGDGEIDASATCTTCASVEYSINGTTFQGSGTFSDLDDGTYTVTARDINDAGCFTTATFTVNTIVDSTNPTAECQDQTVTTDANGMVSITAADIDNGSADNCTLTSVTIDVSDFDCSNIGNNTVTLTATDDSGNTATCTANVEVLGSTFCAEALNFGNNADGADPNGMDPCSCAGNGMFDEEIVMGPDVPGLTFTIQSTTMLEANGSGLTIAAGTALTEIFDAGTGTSIYVLHGQHPDGVGYSAEIVSPNFPGFVFSLSNVCYYPDVAITSPLVENICLFTTPILLTGEETNGATGNGVFDIDGAIVNSIDPMALGLGSYTLTYTFDAGLPANFGIVNGVVVGPVAGPPTFVATEAEAVLDPGCTESVSFTFNIIETPSTVGCNDNIQVSFDENCDALITPDMLLEGTYGCFDDFTVTLHDPIGTPLPNPLTIAHLNTEIIGTVTHDVSGNSCWATVLLEDKLAPEAVCTDFSWNCDVNLPAVGFNVVGVDNCSAATVALTSEVVIDADMCDDNQKQVARTYSATDAWGNVSLTECTQIITIQRVAPVFPGDVEWTCDNYGNNNALITPQFSGAPFSLASDFEACNYGVSHSDILLPTCGYEASTDSPVFKIVRTWTVLDWCTGDVITDGNGDGATDPDPSDDDNVQIIKIIDEVGPTISSDPIEVDINIAGQHPQLCASTGFIPAPELSDNCTGVVSLQIFTPAGELNYVNNDPFSGGFIPGAGLEVGTYTITYVAADGCGNITELPVTLVVADNTAPNVVCDEITDVNISSDGLGFVYATTFDDGSTDNCCLESIDARRMDNPACPGDDATTYAETVPFFCCDANTTVMVELRATDCYGNANTCMVEVNVQDKIAPIITCPAPANITCDEYWDDYEAGLLLCEQGDDEEVCQDNFLATDFGTPTAFDNCEVIVTPNVTINLDQCGEGTIVRSWSATDPSNNGPVSCSQTIFVSHVSDWAVMFPDDIFVDCGVDVPDFGEPTLYFETCELLAVSHEDEVFTNVPDACYKIVRQWIVINWCTVGDNIDQEIVEPSECDSGIDYNGNGINCALNDPIGNNGTIVGHGHRTFREDANTPDGYITYQQVIKVNDTVEPVFNDCSIEDMCIFDGCAMTVNLPTPDVSDCSEEITITVESTDLPGGANGFGPYFNVGVGTYTVVYKATDNCGNWSVCQATFEVEDCKKPTPYCVEGLVIGIMNTPTPMVDVWASDFDAGSFDNCGVKCIAFSDDCNDTQKVYGCDDLGEQIVQLWVQDIYDNWDYCETFVVIQDQMDVCGNGLIVEVAGNVATEGNEDVSDVDVQINSDVFNQNILTGNDGNYSVEVPAGGDYTITPVKDVNYLNGVTTFDLVQISKHILNMNLLDTPYQMIAADANKSGGITTFDMVQVRKLILYIDTEFANNTSWRFVPTDYQFDNPANPFADNFPEVINLNNVTAAQLAQDFVAIKIGDVNGSANPNQLLGADDRNVNGELTFTTTDLELTAGQVYEIPFTAANFNNFGYQFTLDIDGLELVEIREGLAKAENFGMALISENVITTSYSNATATELNNDETIFTLVVKSTQNARLSDLLSINSSYTIAEAYSSNGDLQNVNLVFNGKATKNGFELFQNTPNPFNDITKVGFNLPEATSAVITISDVSGRVLKVVEGDFAKGYNSVEIRKSELSVAGVLYYQVETATHSATMKMILLD